MLGLRSLFQSQETDPERAYDLINSGRSGVWACKSFGICVAISNYAKYSRYSETLDKHNIKILSKKRYSHDWWDSDEGDHVCFSIEQGRFSRKIYEYEVWVTDGGSALGPISEDESGRFFRRITLKCNGKDCVQSSISQWMDNFHWDVELIDYCSYDLEWNKPLQKISQIDPLF